MSTPPKARRRPVRPLRQPNSPSFNPGFLSHCDSCKSRASGIFSVLEGVGLSQLDHARSTRMYPRGTTIFTEGVRIEGLYCVRSGSVKVYKTADDGRHYALRIAGCGDVIGLSSLLTDGCSRASAEMLQDGFLCFTNRRMVLALIGSNPLLARGVMELLAARIIESEEERLALSRRPVGELLARLLLVLGRSHGLVRNERLVIDLELSIEELSEMLGATRETTSRCLTRLRREGILLRDGKKLVIQDLPRLEKLALRIGR